MTRHCTRVFFHALNPRDEVSKQARFLIRLAVACNEAGTPYSVEWKRHGDVMTAAISAEGHIPNAKPLPKAPKDKPRQDWKPNPLTEASYRTRAFVVSKSATYQNPPRTETYDTWKSGYVIEHSSGLALVRAGESETGEWTADDKGLMANWAVMHTASGKTAWGPFPFRKAIEVLLTAAPLYDWTRSKAEIKADLGAKRADLTVKAQFGDKWERSDAQRDLAKLPPVEPAVKEQRIAVVDWRGRTRYVVIPAEVSHAA